MNIFHPGLVHSLDRCTMAAGVGGVHEHTAIRVIHSFEFDTDLLIQLGHIVVAEFPRSSIFFQHSDGTRLELIPGNRPPHEAFAVETREDFEQLGTVLIYDPAFEPFEEIYATDDLCAQLFRHHASKAIIQLVWRRQQIYKDLFSAEDE